MSYRGIGEYDHVKSFAWLYNPPPFDFLDPAGVKPPPQFYAPARTMGFGAPGSGLGPTISKYQAAINKCINRAIPSKPCQGNICQAVSIPPYVLQQCDLAYWNGGLSGLGCPGNPNCSCKCGMGDWSTVNWSLDSSDIAAQFGMTIPNWVLYAGLIGIAAVWKGSFSSKRRR